MTIIGNIILPRKDDFSMGDTEPKLPCLWYNTAASGEPVDPDAIPGLFVYKDKNGNLFSLYPLTSIEAVYGLEDALTGLNDTLDDLNSNLNELTDDNEALRNALSSKIRTAAVNLPQSGWVDGQQTVSVSGVTADTAVVVCGDISCEPEYSDCGIHCAAKEDGALTFRTTYLPDTDMVANVLIFS